MSTLLVLTPENGLPATSNGSSLKIVTVGSNSFFVQDFDAATDQSCAWRIPLQATPSGTVTGKFRGIMASATSGTVQLQVQISAITPGDTTDIDTTLSLDTADGGGTTVPGTAGYEFEISFTISHTDSMVAGDMVMVVFNRDADGTSGSDTATGNYRFTGGVIEDAA